MSLSAPSSATGKLYAAPEVEEVVVVRVLLGDRAGSLVVALEDRLDLARDRLELARRARCRPRATARAGGRAHSVSSASTVTWRRERLGRGDADLGAGVDVDAAVGLARDGRADHVARCRARARPCAAPRASRPACRPSRPTARSRAPRVPWLDDRVAVAELGGVLDLDRDARVLLEHVLADQPGVPRRAAGR